MRQVLERYVLGRGLNVNYDMKELGSLKNDASMRGFWEFRSGPPSEQTRLFGFFALQGGFVATSFKSRARFGGASDPAWEKERSAGEAVWKELFPDAAYLTSPWPVKMSRDFRMYLD